MSILVFDIETVPDTKLGSRLYDLEGLPDDDVAKAMFAKRREKTGGSDFLQHYLHHIVAISIVLKSSTQFKVWSLGDEQSSEEELIRRFFDGIERYQPTLVSWNGGGFDLPVLHYRAMIYGINAGRYWDTGDLDRNYRFNNYINRFHSRHTDLMDVLSGYQARAVAPLDQVAIMLGFPGKLGMSGSAVWPAFQEGKINDIRDYCETDVLNTYLVYLRWEVTRGNLDQSKFDSECESIRTYLAEENREHFTRFLDAWAPV